MTYRNTLIERTRLFESQSEEPAVLDYLQLRNRQCLYDWQVRRAESLGRAAAVSPVTGSAGYPPTRGN